MITTLLAALLIIKFATVSSGGISPIQAGLDAKIVGGYPVNISEVPWQVSVQYHKRHICGGSIISDQWILTTAQCTDDAENHKIRAGATDKLLGGDLYEVDRTIVHEKFAGLFDYDFGLIKLKSKLKFGNGVRSVRLPKVGAEDVEAGTMCLVSGWGDTKNVTVTSRYLRAVEVPIFDQDLCSRRYKALTSRMLCAGYEGGGKDGQ